MDLILSRKEQKTNCYDFNTVGNSDICYHNGEVLTVRAEVRDRDERSFLIVFTIPHSSPLNGNSESGYSLISSLIKNWGS